VRRIREFAETEAKGADAFDIQLVAARVMC